MHSGDEIALLKPANKKLKMRLVEERDGGGEEERIRARAEDKHQTSNGTGYVQRWTRNPGSSMFHS